MPRGRPKLSNKRVEVGLDPGLLSSGDAFLTDRLRPMELPPPADPWEDERGESPLGWWDEFVDEQGERLHHALDTAVERLHGIGRENDRITLDDPVFQEVIRQGKVYIEHFIAGKVLEGLLVPGEKRGQQQEFERQLPALFEEYLGEILAE